MFDGKTGLRGNPGPLRRKRRPGGATAWMRRGLLALLLLAAPLSGAAGGARKPVRFAYQEFNRQMVVDENNKPVLVTNRRFRPGGPMSSGGPVPGERPRR